jgi:hypothetical protein
MRINLTRETFGELTMKKFVVLTLFIMSTLLAACNMQSQSPTSEAETPIEAQANAWQLLGTSLDFSKPALASYSSSTIDKDGNPVIAWQEFDNLQHLIYVKRWTGSEWSFLGSPLNIDANKFAYQPSLAIDASGVPSVAWEEDAATTRNVYVKRWNGSSWVSLGAALNSTGGDGAQNASLGVDGSGNPVVAWEENTLKLPNYQSDVYVKRWNGTAWVQLGGALDVSANRNAVYPSLAVAGNGNPVVAWVEYEGFASNLYVKRWTGSAWQSLGGALNLSSGGAAFPSLALDASGKPVVAWEENSNLYVKRWSGTSWVQVGSTPLDINPTQDAITPSLALDNSGQPVIAWQEFNSNTFYNLYVRRWNGTAWVNVGVNPLETKLSNYAFNASLALDASGNPVVSWEECDATQIHSSGTSCLTGADVYAKRFTSQGWQPLGRTLDIRLENDASFSSIARKSNNQPVVAWQEFGNIYAKEWTGTSWTRLGGKLNTIAGNTPIVAMRSDDKPMVAWSERTDPFSDVYAIRVKYWNGTGWQLQGSVTMPFVHSFALATGNSNNPIIAYSTFGSNGEGINLYVKRWNGSSWVGMNGSITVTPLDFDRARDAGVPTLAVDSAGNPVVSWAETNGLIGNIYVKRWNGTTWVQLGVNLEAAPANNPTMDIDSTGKPVVAWEERVFDGATTQTNIAVKRWNGSAWVSYGTGQAADKILGSHAYDPMLQLRSDDMPVIVMTQLVFRDGATSHDVYMRRWNPSLNQWVDVGVPIDKNIAFNARNPSFVLRSNNNPIVSWDEEDGSSNNVYVSQY